jgi:hypothetical protein
LENTAGNSKRAATKMTTTSHENIGNHVVEQIALGAAEMIAMDSFYAALDNKFQWAPSTPKRSKSF